MANMDLQRLQTELGSQASRSEQDLSDVRAQAEGQISRAREEAQSALNAINDELAASKREAAVAALDVTSLRSQLNQTMTQVGGLWIGDEWSGARKMACGPSVICGLLMASLH